eukprot:GILI01009761.1.p1 GENE.GILI01009761.1~~GILI01009761.1.p1  ORF type:complete len:504 (+),score=164.59 GILI01009761.1:60-1514(+)
MKFVLATICVALLIGVAIAGSSSKKLSATKAEQWHKSKDCGAMNPSDPTFWYKCSPRIQDHHAHYVVLNAGHQLSQRLSDSFANEGFVYPLFSVVDDSSRFGYKISYQIKEGRELRLADLNEESTVAQISKRVSGSRVILRLPHLQSIAGNDQWADYFSVRNMAPGKYDVSLRKLVLFVAGWNVDATIQGAPRLDQDILKELKHHLCGEAHLAAARIHGFILPAFGHDADGTKQTVLPNDLLLCKPKRDLDLIGAPPKCAPEFLRFESSMTITNCLDHRADGKFLHAIFPAHARLYHIGNTLATSEEGPTYFFNKQSALASPLFSSYYLKHPVVLFDFDENQSHFNKLFQVLKDNLDINQYFPQSEQKKALGDAKTNRLYPNLQHFTQISDEASRGWHMLLFLNVEGYKPKDFGKNSDPELWLSTTRDYRDPFARAMCDLFKTVEEYRDLAGYSTLTPDTLDEVMLCKPSESLLGSLPFTRPMN